VPEPVSSAGNQEVIVHPASSRQPGRYRAWVASTLLSTLLVGCEGTFTSDLASDPAADPAVSQVNANLLGVELQKTDGTTENLEFTSSEAVNLITFVDGTPLRLFTDERLPAGDYSGVRLLFDTATDASVINSVGGELPATLVDGPFAPVNFSVKDNRRSLAQITLTLDLRQSLKLNDAGDAYTLTPVARSAITADAATVSGTVASSACPADTTLSTRAAVYLFEGRGVTPDDLDGVDAEPYATTRVVPSGTSSDFEYTLRFLPSGDYTLALTCAGDLEVLDASDDLAFVDTQDVRLDAGDSVQVDLD
jgi:hypothetical protein